MFVGIVIVEGTAVSVITEVFGLRMLDVKVASGVVVGRGGGGAVGLRSVDISSY